MRTIGTCTSELNGARLSYIDFSGVVPNPRLSLVKRRNPHWTVGRC